MDLQSGEILEYSTTSDSYEYDSDIASSSLDSSNNKSNISEDHLEIEDSLNINPPDETLDEATNLVLHDSCNHDSVHNLNNISNISNKETKYAVEQLENSDHVESSHSEVTGDSSLDESTVPFVRRRNVIYDSPRTDKVESSHCEATGDSSLDESTVPFVRRRNVIYDSPRTDKVESSHCEATDDGLDGSSVQFVGRKNVIYDSSTTDSDDENQGNDIIDVSSGEEFAAVPLKKQLTLPQILKTVNINKNVEKKETEAIMVSKSTYEEQKSKVQTLNAELLRIQMLLHTINLPALPDKGDMLTAKLESLKGAIKMAEAKLDAMTISENATSKINQIKQASLEDLKIMSESVQPKTFGQQALATLNAQKTLTMERLEQLHMSLTSCPAVDTHAEDPRGLKVELMPHQKHALAWLQWRENQKPSGGILADDMGLGKTLTMISLVLASKQKSTQPDDEDSDQENEPDDRYASQHRGGSLVVCPASLMRQWESEVEKHCKRFMLEVELYHGPKRETIPRKLAKHDIVVTTYAICMNEYEKKSALYRVRWRRIILDEAHQIRNHKAQTSIAACSLRAQSRWALTGTPVHNNQLDMYSLMKFLRCSPFDDLQVWKRWVANKNTGGQDRIQTVLASIMLRRTKANLQEIGAMIKLPDRTHEVLNIKLQPDEEAVYQKILIFSRTLFAQYLHQHAEKQDNYMQLGNYTKLGNNPNNPYYQMHQKLVKLNKVKEVKSHEILVLLLRLRQMCCHPSLIVKMLHGDQLSVEEEIEGMDEFNLLDEMGKLNLDDEKCNESSRFKGSVKELLNPNNALFSVERKSTKIEAVLELLREKVLKTDEKAIVVSQWASFLRLLGTYLTKEDIPFQQLDGSIPVVKRMPIVDNFNNPTHHAKILLLSLTAGGVGLNLTGGNHMILLDLHWNPQLEMQAQDRIYRVGQTKEVHIYKLVAVNTIEERIKGLQETKLDLANSMLTGAKIDSKLSLQDLRMLFNM